MGLLRATIAAKTVIIVVGSSKYDWSECRILGSGIITYVQNEEELESGKENEHYYYYYYDPSFLILCSLPFCL